MYYEKEGGGEKSNLTALLRPPSTENSGVLRIYEISYIGAYIVFNSSFSAPSCPFFVAHKSSARPNSGFTLLGLTSFSPKTNFATTSHRLLHPQERCSAAFRFYYTGLGIPPA